MRLESSKVSKVPLHLILRNVLRRASPRVVQIGLLSVCIAYALAWIYSPLGGILAHNPDVAISAAFGLGWLAFTTLLSAEREAVRPPPGSRVLPSDGLGSELSKLASERELHLDCFAYSTETLLAPLTALLNELAIAERPAQSLVIRILVKDWKYQLLLPGCADNSEINASRIESYRVWTTQYHERMRGELQARLREAQSELNPVKVDFRFKAYPFDPVHKGILINRKVGFWSLYPIRPTLLKGYEGALDYQGKNVRFVELRANGTASESEALRSMCEWFDTIWTLCSCDA